jgi:hypothetical protein
VVIGVTGSGKTQAALWQLSIRRFDLMPWLVVNYKHDELIDGIPHVRHIDLDELPVAPGVYVVHPGPGQEPELERLLWAVWERGHVGLYVDEGYMLGHRNEAFRAILTQGRSKHIPAITLTQRPAWIDTFVFSEADFIQVFKLRHDRDRVRVAEFSPIDLDKPLPPYYSYYFDATANSGAGDLVILRPVPSIQTIHQTFARRLANRRVAV